MLCAEHRARYSAAVQRLRDRRRSAGLCLDCGHRRPRPSRNKCWPCAWKATVGGRQVLRRIREDEGTAEDLRQWTAILASTPVVA